METYLFEFAVFLAVLINTNVCALECAGGWTQFANSCYKGFDDTKIREKSQELCIQQESNLVSIASKEEFYFVMNLISHKNDVWIGLKRDSPPKSANLTTRTEGWSWEDGSPLTWSNWQTDEPHFSDTKVVISRHENDTWIGYNQVLYLPRVCERALSPMGTTDRNIKKILLDSTTESQETVMSSIRVYETTQESVTGSGGTNVINSNTWDTIIKPASAAAAVVFVVSLLTCLLFRFCKKTPKKDLEKDPSTEQDAEEQYDYLDPDAMDLHPRNTGVNYIDMSEDYDNAESLPYVPTDRQLPQYDHYTEPSNYEPSDGYLSPKNLSPMQQNQSYAFVT